MIGGGTDMGNYYAYMRISTEEELKKQRYSRQETALGKYAQENKIEFLLEFREDKSGKNFTDRKQWSKLEAIAQPGDTIVFKDISRFTREAEAGYQKYMELMNKGIDLIFIDNPTVSTTYIKNMLNMANEMDLVNRISIENTIRLLLYVELDRVEKERTILIKRIRDGLSASTKKSGRPAGSISKMSPELETDLRKLMSDRSIKYTSIMKKYNISRNTLKKYIKLLEN